MTRRIRCSLVLTGLFALHAHGWAAQTAPRPDGAPATAVGSAAAPSRFSGQSAYPRTELRGQPSFWEDSVKAIKEGGWDVGRWIAYRRRLLVEASLTNRYFWFCITSFVSNVLLLYVFYACRVGEDRKLWKATEAMTDLWNWALFADWQARQAIDRFNTHIEQCDRAQASTAACSTDRTEDLGELARIQKERDDLREENLALQERLIERDQSVTALSARIDEVSKTLSASDSGSILSAQLMEKINLLTEKNQRLEQRLKSAQNKLAELAQGVG